MKKNLIFAVVILVLAGLPAQAADLAAYQEKIDDVITKTTVVVFLVFFAMASLFLRELYKKWRRERGLNLESWAAAVF